MLVIVLQDYRILEDEKTVGSGFIIRSDGYLITCHHVIYRLEQLIVEYRGQRYPAEWLPDLSNPEVDVAILKIDRPEEADAVWIINPESLATGTSVTVYGFPDDVGDYFQDGYPVKAEIQENLTVKTLKTFPAYDYATTGRVVNPWNKKPHKNSTFKSHKINRKVGPGTSGAPVLVEDQGVVGMLQSSRMLKGKEESYFIRWENIKEAVDQLGLTNERHYVLISDFNRSFSKVNNVLNDIRHNQKGRNFIYIKTSELKENYPYSKVYFGCLMASNDEILISQQLLKNGVPIILIGGKHEAHLMKSMLKHQNIKRGLEDIIYTAHKRDEIKGAIHWIINYYHDIKEMAIKAREIEEIENERASELIEECAQFIM